MAKQKYNDLKIRPDPILTNCHMPNIPITVNQGQASEVSWAAIFHFELRLAPLTVTLKVVMFTCNASKMRLPKHNTLNILRTRVAVYWHHACHIIEGETFAHLNLCSLFHTVFKVPANCLVRNGFNQELEGPSPATGFCTGIPGKTKFGMKRVFYYGGPWCKFNCNCTRGTSYEQTHMHSRIYTCM